MQKLRLEKTGLRHIDMNINAGKIKSCEEHTWGNWICNNQRKPLMFRVCTQCPKVDIKKMKNLEDVIKISIKRKI